MLAGHYAASLVLKSVEKRASLGLLFIAAQLVDFLVPLFAVFGLEHYRFVEGFTESTDFELVSVSYTHSLVAAFVWAAIAYGIVRRAKPTLGGVKSIATVVAVAVLSHWFLDLLVHTADLPLLGDGSPKLGLGLWNSAPASLALEVIFIGGSTLMYLRATSGAGPIARYGMIGLATVMLMLTASFMFGPPVTENIWVLMVVGFLINSAIVGAAFWLDRYRD